MILQHYKQHPVPDNEDSDDAARDREVRADMGVRYDTLVRTEPWRRDLLAFLYHPYTELIIFALILVSISMLVIEVTVFDEAAAAGWGCCWGARTGCSSGPTW